MSTPNYDSPEFISYCHKQNIIPDVSKAFWSAKPVRLNFYQVKIIPEAFDVFDSCLFMHELPQLHYREWWKHEYTDLYQAGYALAKEGDVFSSPVHIGMWLGWFMYWKNEMQIPLPLETLWQMYCTMINMMPDDSSQYKH